jgi:hypothetical protein
MIKPWKIMQNEVGQGQGSGDGASQPYSAWPCCYTPGRLSPIGSKSKNMIVGVLKTKSLSEWANSPRSI